MASYEKLKSGWSVRFRCIENGKEYNKRLSGLSTKKEAEQAYIDFIGETHESSHRCRIVIFDVVYESWLQKEKLGIRESSYVDMVSITKKNIVPFFKNKRLDKITPKNILDWQHEIMSRFSYKYFYKLRHYLNSILEHGNIYFDVPSVAIKVAIPKNKSLSSRADSVKVWDRFQFDRFLNVVDERYRLYFKTLYETGMRKNECLALTWRDVDLDSCKINIHSSISTKGQKSWNVTDTKNKTSSRVISIPKRIALELAKIKSKADFFVFGGIRPFPERNLDRAFSKARDSAELPFLTIHGLRHSFVSNAISNGLPILSISKYIGHSSLRQTLDTYAHLIKKDSDVMDSYILNL